MSDRFACLITDLEGEPDPCQAIIKSAEQYYKVPLKNLQLKQPLHVLYAAEEREETLGDFIASVPKPGEVAGCLKIKKGRNYEPGTHTARRR